jgi:hypothetical protein
MVDGEGTIQELAVVPPGQNLRLVILDAVFRDEDDKVGLPHYHRHGMTGVELAKVCLSDCNGEELCQK